MISVSQIYLDAKTQKHLDPYFYPYLQEGRDEYFENSVIRKLYEMPEILKQGITYQGVTSWQQKLKTHLSGKDIIEFIQKDITAQCAKDVYLYTPVQGIKPRYDYDKLYYHGTICQPDIWAAHRNLNDQLVKDAELLNKSGVLPFDLFNGKWQYSYCNYWIATPKVYNEYCKTVLIPAMDFFERNEIKTSLVQWYTHRHESRKCTSICFILEGLFGAFLANNNYTFDYICKKKINSKFKMVKIDSYQITN